MGSTCIAFLRAQASQHLQGYQRAELITSEELALIRRVDRQPRTKVESAILGDGPTFALLYLSLLKKLARVDTMQYILALIAEALTGLPIVTLNNWCTPLT
jgi:hypothetical protein